MLWRRSTRACPDIYPKIIECYVRGRLTIQKLEYSRTIKTVAGQRALQDPEDRYEAQSSFLLLKLELSEVNYGEHLTLNEYLFLIKFIIFITFYREKGTCYQLVYALKPDSFVCAYTREYGLAQIWQTPKFKTFFAWHTESCYPWPRSWPALQ